MSPARGAAGRAPAHLPLLGCLLLLECQVARGAPARAPGTRTPTDEPAIEIVFDRGLTSHWHDFGWAPRELVQGQPARVDFSERGGWIVANPELQGRFAALRFRLKAPAEMGDFLEVHLDSGKQDAFPRIKVGPQHRVDRDDGWTEVRLPMSELNPEGLSYDRFVLVGLRSTPPGFVLLDDIALTPDLSAATSGAPTSVREVRLVADCSAPSTPISDLIYGIGGQTGQEAKDAAVWQLGATARRWGGNPTSTYNWKLGNAWNTGNDWFFRNVALGDPGFSYRRLLDEDVATGVKTALTLPMLGWVAKDTDSSSFPVSVFGVQGAQDPYSEAGNGVTKGGAQIEAGPQTTTSIPAPPSFVGDWVRHIREEDKKRGGRSVALYILDNEPSLWSSSHRDLHPQPVSYDELLKRTIDYGSEVRRADSAAVIAGPAEWGWPSYFYSAVDGVTKYKLNPDRLAHGDVPLIPWYLRKLHEQEVKTGVRLLDVLDVHYYPMADRVGGAGGGTDAKTAELRLRSTRSLWDPTYVDESWIKDTIRLIPRLKEWIAENDPGIGISIGEWNFGAEKHISGGLAAAEALGRFGVEGVFSAFYWTYPPLNSAAFWAFRAFRNFDGKGGHFLARSVPTKTAEGVSLFASRDEAGGHLVLIALNLDPHAALSTQIDLATCGRMTAEREFSYSGGAAGLTEVEAHPAASTVQAVLDPYSITVFDLKVAK